MDSIIALRHELHRNPGTSGKEKETAERIARFFKPLAPDAIFDNLGGTGVAVVFSGAKPGQTIMLRAELDALPIQERNHLPYSSANPGKAHLCGHDGHMAILAAVGSELATARPAKGRVVLLFQPAEETGAGAAAVTRDARFPEIAPDYVFAMHNLPGFPLGQVVIRNGVFSAASRGITIGLHGTPAHAAQPETGHSPATAMARIIEKMAQLPSDLTSPDETAFITVVGAQLGDKAFGTAPAEAEIWATLRSTTDSTMAALTSYVEKAATDLADAFNLDCTIGYSDVFAATLNSARANDIVRHNAEGQVHELDQPFRWSEDFGHFSEHAEGALFGMGAGTDMPELHNSNYDFPDDLLAPAAQLFQKLIRQFLG